MRQIILTVLALFALSIVYLVFWVCVEIVVLITGYEPGVTHSRKVTLYSDGQVVREWREVKVWKYEHEWKITDRDGNITVVTGTVVSEPELITDDQAERMEAVMNRGRLRRRGE